MSFFGIKEGTKLDTDWSTKDGEMQQDFLWALGPEAKHQKSYPEKI